VSLRREVEYIIERAQEHAARLSVLQSLILFSTETGDTWILDPADKSALCLARDGDKQSFTVLDTATQFGVEWAATYEIDGDAFIVKEKSGRMRTIIGYPTREIQQAMHQQQ
jgi:hypothetical protein